MKKKLLLFNGLQIKKQDLPTVLSIVFLSGYLVWYIVQHHQRVFDGVKAIMHSIL